jgi:hypothetical protein
MGVYLLSEGIHYKADMVKAKFYWEGNGGLHKYIIWLTGKIFVSQENLEAWVSPRAELRTSHCFLSG